VQKEKKAMEKKRDKREREGLPWDRHYGNRRVPRLMIKTQQQQKKDMRERRKRKTRGERKEPETAKKETKVIGGGKAMANICKSIVKSREGVEKRTVQAIEKSGFSRSSNEKEIRKGHGGKKTLGWVRAKTKPLIRPRLLTRKGG